MMISPRQIPCGIYLFIFVLVEGSSPSICSNTKLFICLFLMIILVKRASNSAEAGEVGSDNVSAPETH